MNKTDVLYVKGMNMSESEREIEEEDEDIWDDRKLNAAYDKALKMANAEVAKRIAMSTNTNTNHKDSKKASASKSHSSKSQKTEAKTSWKAGMDCRAIYEEDGLEYEAYLHRIINDKECVVRFLGYNNTEVVPLSTLKPSLGQTEQTRQIEEALLDKSDSFSEVSRLDKMECSDRGSSIASSDTYNRKKKSSKNKKKKAKPATNGFQFPDMPMPDISQLRNLGSMDMPIPPPLPLSLPRDNDSEDQAVCSMLLSWYMSGYYTGLYRGMKRAQEGRKNQ